MIEEQLKCKKDLHLNCAIFYCDKRLNDKKINKHFSQIRIEKVFEDPVHPIKLVHP